MQGIYSRTLIRDYHILMRTIDMLSKYAGPHYDKGCYNNEPKYTTTNGAPHATPPVDNHHNHHMRSHSHTHGCAAVHHTASQVMYQAWP